MGSTVCSVHRLQTCLKYALDEKDVASLIRDSRKPVGHFRHSAKATQALLAQQTNTRRPKKLSQDIVTRWSATFYILERLLLLHLNVVAVLSDKQTSKASDVALDLRSSQWLLASQLVKVLRPFELATRIMSSEENVSVSITPPLMEGLARGLVNDEEDLTARSNVQKGAEGAIDESL